MESARIAASESVDTFPPVLRNPGGKSLLGVDPQNVIDVCKEHGAVLVFGYRATLAEFEQFTNLLCSDWQTYRGGAHDKQVLNPDSDHTIYSVNFYFGREEQFTFPLPLHSEMSYMKNRPAIVCFYAVHPPADRGETTVCDGLAFRNALSEKTRRLFEDNRILYVRTTPAPLRRQKFYTENFAEAEAFCRENDLTLEEDAEGNWTTRYVVSAFRETAWGNHTVFSNSILPVLEQMDNGLRGSLVLMEDGSPIPPDVVAELRDVADRTVRRIKWEQPGDFALMDNTRVLHGRESFEDLKRNVAQRLGRSVSW
jgi:alpha-ketoglutarate-dependent taurine dioxygenase